MGSLDYVSQIVPTVTVTTSANTTVETEARIPATFVDRAPADCSNDGPPRMVNGVLARPVTTTDGTRLYVRLPPKRVVPVPATRVTWPEDVKFIHGRHVPVTTKRQPLGTLVDVTVAYRFVKNSQGRKSLQVGFSFCSPEDHFDHQRGRTLAFQRLQREPYSIPLRGDRTNDPYEIIDAFLAYAVLTKTSVPGKPNSWTGWSTLLGSWMT